VTGHASGDYYRALFGLTNRLERSYLQNCPSILLLSRLQLSVVTAVVSVAR